jgi:opacity protein-like surface antigen
MISERRTLAVFAVVLLFLFFVGGTQSQAIPPANADRWEISLGGGYYIPAREGFREYYKNGPEAELGVSHQVWRQFSARVDLSFTRLPHKQTSADLLFWMFSIVPSIKLSLPRAQEPYLGAGLGYYQGTVKYDGPYYPTGGGEKEISKGGIGFKLYAGLKSNLVSRLFLGLEGRYCHTFLGDPYRGDFGNVGGFSVMGKLGVSF